MDRQSIEQMMISHQKEIFIISIIINFLFTTVNIYNTYTTGTAISLSFAIMGLCIMVFICYRFGLYMSHGSGLLGKNRMRTMMIGPGCYGEQPDNDILERVRYRVVKPESKVEKSKWTFTNWQRKNR